MIHRNTAQAAAPSNVARSMAKRWSLAFAILAITAGLGVFVARLHAESANSDFKQGQAAEAREDYDSAFDLYQKAYKRDPKDTRFQIALARIRTTASSAHITTGRKLLQSGDVQGALSQFLHAAEIDPGNEAAQQEIARVRQHQGNGAQVPESSYAASKCPAASAVPKRSANWPTQYACSFVGSRSGFHA